MLEDLEAWRHKVELVIKTPEPPKSRWGINENLINPDLQHGLLFDSGSVFQRKRVTLDNFEHLYDVIYYCDMDMHKVADFYGYGSGKLSVRGLYNWLYKNGALPALYVAMGKIIDTINMHITDIKIADVPLAGDGSSLDQIVQVSRFNTILCPPALAGLSKQQCIKIRSRINWQRNACVGLRLGYDWNAPPPTKTKVDIRITY